jgi:multimeric flavodoxin WrbA
MKKKILVISGSPRKDGNSKALAKAFIDGALQSGHDIIEYDIADHNIQGCVVCNSCFSKNRACTFDDVYSKFADLVKDVDALVISTPLYWFSYPAQLKALIDKFYSFEVGQRKLKIKDAFLLTCGELEDERVFSGLVESYSQLCILQGWNNRGTLIVPKVIDKGDIEKTTALKKAIKLGIDFLQ